MFALKHLARTTRRVAPFLHKTMILSLQLNLPQNKFKWTNIHYVILLCNISLRERKWINIVELFWIYLFIFVVYRKKRSKEYSFKYFMTSFMLEKSKFFQINHSLYSLGFFLKYDLNCFFVKKQLTIKHWMKIRQFSWYFRLTSLWANWMIFL